MAVAHLAFDFRAGNKRRDGVDHHDVDGAGSNEHVHDLERLLAGVGLGHQERVGVDPKLLRVLRVEGVLGVNEGRDATVALGACHRVEGHRGLTRGLRAVDLDDAAAGQAADAERGVKGDRARGDRFDGCSNLIAKPHDGALAVLLVNLREGSLEGLLTIGWCSHCSPRLIVPWACEPRGPFACSFRPYRPALTVLGGRPVCEKTGRTRPPSISLSEQIFE